MASLKTCSQNSRGAICGSYWWLHLSPMFNSSQNIFIVVIITNLPNLQPSGRNTLPRGSCRSSHLYEPSLASRLTPSCELGWIGLDWLDWLGLDWTGSFLESLSSFGSKKFPPPDQFAHLILN